MKDLTLTLTGTDLIIYGGIHCLFFLSLIVFIILYIRSVRRRCKEVERLTNEVEYERTTIFNCYQQDLNRMQKTYEARITELNSRITQATDQNRKMALEQANRQPGPDVITRAKEFHRFLQGKS